MGCGFHFAMTLITQFDLNPHGNLNSNYNILTHELSVAKYKHIPREVKRFNKKKNFKHKLMTSGLLFFNK